MSPASFSIVLFLVALAIVLVATPLVRSAAGRLGAVDRPDGQRRLHSRPVPKLGGVALFFSFYAAVALVLPFWDDPSGRAAEVVAWQIFGPSLLILALGIADDMWGVKPWTKVGVQLLAGLWIAANPDFRIVLLSNPFGASIGTVGALAIPLTLAWVVLITNAFNIVDGMDGLASGVAFVATACLFVTSLLGPDALYLTLLIAPLGGVLVGFLRYNFNPATIFLGDSGSLWLGFLIAVLSIAGQNKSSTAIAVSAPMMFLALPLMETAVSMLRRFLRGQPIWQADASHIHHQLLKRGFTARRAVLLLYMASGFFGVASLFLMTDPSRIVVGIVTVTLVSTAWFGLQRLGYSEFAEVERAFKRGFLYQRRIIRNSIVVRKLIDDVQAATSIDDAWPLIVEVLDDLYFVRAELLPEAGVARAEPRRWAGQEAAPASSELLVLSVHLRSADREVGRLVLSRRRDEEPLHSELPVLLDGLAEQLPRLLEAHTSEASPEPSGAGVAGPLGIHASATEGGVRGR